MLRSLIASFGIEGIMLSLEEARFVAQRQAQLGKASWIGCTMGV